MKTFRAGAAAVEATPQEFPVIVNGGYTTWRARSSCLELDAEPKIATAVLGLLGQVARPR